MPILDLSDDELWPLDQPAVREMAQCFPRPLAGKRVARKASFHRMIWSGGPLAVAFGGKADMTFCAAHVCF